MHQEKALAVAELNDRGKHTGKVTFQKYIEVIIVRICNLLTSLGARGLSYTVPKHVLLSHSWVVFIEKALCLVICLADETAYAPGN